MLDRNILYTMQSLQTTARGSNPASQGLQSGLSGALPVYYEHGTKNSEWPWKLPVLVDLAMYLNDFNIWMQDETSLICDLYFKVKLE